MAQPSPEAAILQPPRQLNRVGSIYAEALLYDPAFMADLDQYLEDMQARNANARAQAEPGTEPATIGQTVVEIKMLFKFVHQDGYVNFEDFETSLEAGELAVYGRARAQFMSSLALPTKVILGH